MHKRIYGLFVLSAAIILASCSQQPIFWAIEQEIELAEPSIKGNVYSVVRCGNYLYAANGNVYRKSLKSVRGWKKISAPPKSAVYLASSSTHVYALGAHKNDCQVYVLDGNTWQEVNGASGKAGDTDETKKIVIFDNGVIGSAGRNAYVRVNGKVFKLNGADPVSALGSDITINGAGAKTVAAAAGGSGDYFSDKRAFCSDGSKLYSADGKTVKWGTTNADLTNTSVQTSEIITCLVCDAANSRLIAGTEKGLEEIKLDLSKKPISAGILGSNAEAAFGESKIFCVASFDNDDNNAIYTGTGKASASKHNALWGYYPSRGNWNYE